MVVCQSNLRQWGLAFVVYTDQNEGCMFAAFHGGGTPEETRKETHFRTVRLIPLGHD